MVNIMHTKVSSVGSFLCADVSCFATVTACENDR